MRWPLIWRQNGVNRARYEQVIDQRDEARTEAAEHVCKIVELCNEVDGLREQLAARGQLVQQRGTALGRISNRLDHIESEYSHIDGYAARMEERLDRALKAAARYLAAYHAEKKRADGLQAQLDHALGLNDPAVEAGQHWQARRMDKPHPPKETS
jgi:chromosome segregation ATPase